MRPLPVSGGDQRESGTFFFEVCFLIFLVQKVLLSRHLLTICFIFIDLQNEKTTSKRSQTLRIRREGSRTVCPVGYRIVFRA